MLKAPELELPICGETKEAHGSRKLLIPYRCLRRHVHQLVGSVVLIHQEIGGLVAVRDDLPFRSMRMCASESVYRHDTNQGIY